jgi:hypothetical protein
MPLELPRDCCELLKVQSGVISRDQALALGLSRSDIWSQLRGRRWQRLQRGVYATFTGVPSRPAQLWAVALSAGQEAALSHHTAAELFGLTAGPAALIHVTVPADERPWPIRGAVVHRSRLIEQTRHPALLPPRTRIEATVLDLTQISADLDQAFNWICLAVSRRLTTTDRLQADLTNRQRARWRADLLVALGDVEAGARSSLERRYINSVERAHGLPEAKRQRKITVAGRTHYIDNLYEEALLAVELDGRAAHPPEQRWADNQRDNAHASLGILTVRYNWADVAVRSCFTAGQVAGLLSARGTCTTLRACGPDCTAVAGIPSQSWQAYLTG